MLGVIINIFVFALLILFIARQMQAGLTLSKQILLGLFLGVFFGLALIKLAILVFNDITGSLLFLEDKSNPNK